MLENPIGGRIIRKKYTTNKILYLSWFVIITGALVLIPIANMKTLADFRNPLNIADELEPVSQIEVVNSTSEQVLIVFSDGLRYDKIVEANTPNIDNLVSSGVVLTDYRAVLPSFSHPNYVSMFTGTSPNISSVISNLDSELVTLPNLFQQAQENNLSTGIVTVSHSWIDLYGEYFDHISYHEEAYKTNHSNAVIQEAALLKIPINFSDIQLIAFDDTDTLGHKYGAASMEYKSCIEELDTFIGELVALYDSLGKLENTTIIITSDHGMLDNGGHGGTSEQETHASLILSGNGIVNNTVITEKFATNSLASTLFALLGIPLNSVMNGKIIFDALDISLRTQTIYSIQFAEILYQQLLELIDRLTLVRIRDVDYFYGKTLTIDSIIEDSKELYETSLSNSFSRSADAISYTRNTITERLQHFQNYLLFINLLELFGAMLIIGVFLAVLNVRKRESLSEHRILFNKQLILAQFSGVVAFFLTMFAFTRFQYSPYTIQSVNDVIVPNLLVVIIGGILAIFLPWLIVYLINKKAQEKQKFDDWSIDFLKSSVGSLFYITLIFTIFTVIYSLIFGSIPSWIIPQITYLTAFIIFDIVAAAVSLLGIIITTVLWIKERKQERQMWLQKQAKRISSNDQ